MTESDVFEVLHNEFDINVHKETFTNYLEVIIDKDGVVHYAVPSHQEYLIAKVQEKYNIGRDAIMSLVPDEFYADFNAWLMKETGSVLVWNCGYNYYIELTTPQKVTIDKLIFEGLLTDNDMSDDYWRRQL